jgi:phosphatidylserine decarboxylase
MIVRDAYRFLIPLAILAALAFWLGFNIPGGVFVVLFAFVAFFFRNPPRKISEDPRVIVSPADGKVVRVERVGNVTQMSIFLSLFNVHVNPKSDSRPHSVRRLSSGKVPRCV